MSYRSAKQGPPHFTQKKEVFQTRAHRVGKKKKKKKIPTAKSPVSVLNCAWGSKKPDQTSRGTKYPRQLFHSFGKKTKTERKGRYLEDLDVSRYLTVQPFQGLLALFSKFFASFHHCTCSLSVSEKYLALAEGYLPICSAFPN